RFIPARSSIKLKQGKEFADELVEDGLVDLEKVDLLWSREGIGVDEVKEWLSKTFVGEKLPINNIFEDDSSVSHHPGGRNVYIRIFIMRKEVHKKMSALILINLRGCLFGMEQMKFRT
nr:hypothetical protein [Tanacetum cinerariifolium]